MTLLFIIAGYLVGGIPFGVLVSQKFAQKDVRSQGSGSTGATNVSRLMGKKWGLFVLFLDGLKGFAIVKIYLLTEGNPDIANLVALAAVLGHCYPPYLKFKGGKGVATTLGVLLALSPTVVLGCLAIFALTILTSKIVSLSSLAAATSLPLFALLGDFNLTFVGSLGIAAVVWWKHQENIKRLLAKQEPKFF